MGSCERYVTENQARMRDGARPLRAGMVPPHILQVGEAAVYGHWCWLPGPAAV